MVWPQEEAELLERLQPVAAALQAAAAVAAGALLVEPVWAAEQLQTVAGAVAGVAVVVVEVVLVVLVSGLR